jgi:hypothetical protein
MKYKFIFFIISCSQLDKSNPYYTDYAMTRFNIFKTYNKLYLDMFKDDIKFFFIEYNKNITQDILEVDDYIYVKGVEEPIVPNMLIKRLRAMTYIQSKYDFDYIINTNLSTFWNISSLMSLYNIIPRNNFFGGHYVYNSFITGTGIIFSNDTLSTLFTINAHTFTANDDVAISHFMMSKGFPVFNLANLQNYIMNWQDLDENDTNVNSPHHKNNILEINENTNTRDILYFRIKNANQKRDIFIAKNVLKNLYNIEV